MTEKNNPMLQELERVFAVLNKRLFSGKLKTPQFSIQPKKKVSVRWFVESGIVLGSDFPNLECDELLMTLLHEMIHIKNHQEEVQDCTTNHYHNKYFLNVALEVGLVVIKHKTQGWSITTTMLPRNVVERDFVRKPTIENREKCQKAFVAADLDRNLFKRVCTEMRSKAKQEKPTKTFFLKYVCNCPPPHNSIRSGRRPDGPNALNVHCENCHSKFICVSSVSDEEN